MHHRYPRRVRAQVSAFVGQNFKSYVHRKGYLYKTIKVRIAVEVGLIYSIVRTISENILARDSSEPSMVSMSIVLAPDTLVHILLRLASEKPFNADDSSLTCVLVSNVWLVTSRLFSPVLMRA